MITHRDTLSPFVIGVPDLACFVTSSGMKRLGNYDTGLSNGFSSPK